jgi:FeS assembly protein IscX
LLCCYREYSLEWKFAKVAVHIDLGTVMGLRWTDTIDIAIELLEAHPDVDPQWIRFTDLHAWVCALPDFEDNPEKSTEGLLEAIQMAWIDEAN